MHVFLISLHETMDINTKLLISLETLRMNKMPLASVFAVSTILSECGGNRNKRNVWIKPESASDVVFLLLTTCCFGGMLANDDLDVHINARENVLHTC